MKLLKTAPLAGCLVALGAGHVHAADYKIGVSAGLTGYAAAVDRAWRDGLEVAADYVNSKGGIMGRKVQVIAEDNKSEPQEAVTVYRKMISSDKVDIFLSGCVSAGNVRRRAVRGASANPDGAVLDPAASARAGEMGLQPPAAASLRGGEAL
jgi:hypothetical protein